MTGYSYVCAVCGREIPRKSVVIDTLILCRGCKRGQGPNSNKGYLFEGVHFDSSWELAYYIWLRDNGKSFIYHPDTPLEYWDSEGVLRNYYPDFLIEGEFVEIKGDHFFNEKGEPYNHYEKKFWWGKYNTLLREGIRIMRFREIKRYLKYVKEIYGKDYLKSFKRSNLDKVQRLSKGQ